MQINVYNLQAKKIKLTTWVGTAQAKINEELLTQAVRVYLGNQRQSPAKTKTRGEVSGSTRKLFRQKGTGRARHGDRKAPIFVKGGRAHGPSGEQNYQRKLTKKMKQKAIISSLNLKIKDKKLIIVSGLDKITAKTKNLHQALTNLSKKLDFGSKLMPKIGLIIPQKIGNLLLAGRNIPYLKIIPANQLNAYEILENELIILMPESLEIIKKTYVS